MSERTLSLVGDVEQISVHDVLSVSACSRNSSRYYI